MNNKQILNAIIRFKEGKGSNQDEHTVRRIAKSHNHPLQGLALEALGEKK